MKFKNLILIALLAGTLVTNTNAMKRHRVTQDPTTQGDGEPVTKKVNTGALATTDAAIDPWLPREILVNIFAFSAPFKNAHELFNLMYTCKDWYHTFINQENGKLHDHVANLFFKLHGCFGESYALTNERFCQIDTDTALLHAWALEKCGTSFPLYTSVDEIGTADMWDLPLGKILVSIAKKSFDPNSQNTKTGNTLLYAYKKCYFGQEAMAMTRILFKFGVNPLICDQDDSVAYNGFDDKNRLLFYLTLDPQCKNKTATGKTLLHLIFVSYPSFISHNFEELSQLNINPNVQCNQGNTPLHDIIQCTFVGKSTWTLWHYENGDYLKKCYAHLLKLSANPTIANNAGETSLALAKRFQADPNVFKRNNAFTLEIIEMLEQAAKEAEEKANKIIEINEDETMTDLG